MMPRHNAVVASSLPLPDGLTALWVTDGNAGEVTVEFRVNASGMIGGTVTARPEKWSQRDFINLFMWYPAALNS